MAVLGHSNATGEDSDPAQPHAVIRANSWATGTNPAVSSVYLRILAKNPAIKGHDFNLAQQSATVDDLLIQAQQALALKPKPGLFLVQIMDADMVCPATHGDYATFRSKLITALGVLARGAPHSRIFVVSQWGSPTTYRKALRPAQRQQFVAGDQGGGGTGPCAFIDPRGRLVPKEAARLETIIHGYEARLAAGCRRVPRCTYDRGAFGRQVDKLGAVVHGQARLGHGAGDVAGERRQRVAVRQAVPAGTGQPGYCLREFRGLGCCAQRTGIGLAEISVSHAVPP
jgi:hypothetical protein